MQLSYDYAKDRALVCLRANYEPHLRISSRWSTDKKFKKNSGPRQVAVCGHGQRDPVHTVLHMSPIKQNYDATSLFKAVKEKVGFAPKILVSDGLQSFKAACKRACLTPKKTIIHIREIHLQNRYCNSNAHERFNSELAECLKVRSLKKDDSSRTQLAIIHHNFIRSHQGLHRLTPADMAGICIDGSDKWLVLIQNAALAATWTFRGHNPAACPCSLAPILRKTDAQAPHGALPLPQNRHQSGVILAPVLYTGMPQNPSGRKIGTKAESFQHHPCFTKNSRIWQEESAGKTKQILEACRRRKGSRSIRGDGLGDGIDLLYCPGLAGSHARGISEQTARLQAHLQEEDADRNRLDVYQEMVEWQPAERRIRGWILAD